MNSIYMYMEVYRFIWWSCSVVHTPERRASTRGERRPLLRQIRAVRARPRVRVHPPLRATEVPRLDRGFLLQRRMNFFIRLSSCLRSVSSADRCKVIAKVLFHLIKCNFLREILGVKYKKGLSSLDLRCRKRHTPK